MAEIDKAPMRYRAVIELWWWLEKRDTRAVCKYFDDHPDAVEVPRWYRPLGSFFFVQRKNAERRALRKIGYIR